MGTGAPCEMERQTRTVEIDIPDSLESNGQVADRRHNYLPGIELISAGVR